MNALLRWINRNLVREDLVDRFAAYQRAERERFA